MLNYKVGDLVRVRRYKDLACQYYHNTHGFYQQAGLLREIIEECCGKVFVVKETSNTECVIREIESNKIIQWYFSGCYLEDVEGCETQ